MKRLLPMLLVLLVVVVLAPVRGVGDEASAPGALLRTLTGHTDQVESVTVTPDATKIVSGADDKTVRVWDLNTGECLRTLTGHTGFVWSVAVTPDGSKIVSGSHDQTIKVWSMP